MALSPTSSHGASGTGTGTLLYDFTVSVAQAVIDTNVDGTYAGAISGAYRVLQVTAYWRTDEAVAISGINGTVNNDGTGIYDRQSLTGNNVTASATNGVSGLKWDLAAPGSSMTSGTFGVLEMMFPNYAGTTGNKTGTARYAGADASAAANDFAICYALGYRSTTALSRFAFTPNTAAKKFIAGTRLIIVAW